MAMTCMAAVIGATSVATALFTGIIPPDAMGADILSLALAGLTGIAVASAAALDSRSLRDKVDPAASQRPHWRP